MRSGAGGDAWRHVASDRIYRDPPLQSRHRGMHMLASFWVLRQRARGKEHSEQVKFDQQLVAWKELNVCCGGLGTSISDMMRDAMARSDHQHDMQHSKSFF